MTDMLIIYTTPDCRTCGAATRKLDAEGIPYTKVDVTEDAEAAERLRRNGLTQAPVFGWHGHLHTIAGLPDIIRAHKEAA